MYPVVQMNHQSMESSESTDDSFRARVQKAFGPLSSSQSPWSLTDDEIEKREWNRGRGGGSTTRDDDAIPCSSSFDGIFTKDRKKKSRHVRRELGNDVDDLNDDDDGDGCEPGDGGDEWEIRSSIGMDSTLDNEEEEDEYDKVAAGRENASDVWCMSDVTNHGPYLNSYNVIPSSGPDPRANRLAASIRLKEDELEAGKIGPNYTRDKPFPNVKEPSKSSEDGRKPKSILKRKNDEAGSKEQKRVKFDPSCKDDFEEESENANNLLTGDHLMATTILDDNPQLGSNTIGVPDYARNPSKYTRYSFDSAIEVEDKSSSRVMDFNKLVKMSKPEESGSLSGDASSPLPKSVVFIPRKKAPSATARDSSCEVKQNQEDGSDQSVIQTGFPLGIADDDTETSEIRGMEDEMESSAEETSTKAKKQSRTYRTRSNLDDTVT